MPDSRKGAGVPLYNVTLPAPYMFPELDTVAYMERLITDNHSGVEAGGDHFGNDAGGRQHLCAAR